MRSASGAGDRPATAELRVYRTAYRKARNSDPRYPPNVYSESDNLDYARSDLAYLRTERGDVKEAWIETRTVTPWERTDD